ncbi:hypothetical protein M404DRAFT_998033 [Pisolithus tinctorius Marx 270]|uniref:Uncharacterized protein n=1 Tax=Pisolithus tinctorius Marx 270 TaxID=870435 RepID=A0A0C3PHE2_PISTI|nr:hypothetical protein M404DRAFT_998033 [Pisolithus tinctorius Marx 270]
MSSRTLNHTLRLQHREDRGPLVRGVDYRHKYFLQIFLSLLDNTPTDNQYFRFEV